MQLKGIREFELWKRFIYHMVNFALKSFDCRCSCILNSLEAKRIWYVDIDVDKTFMFQT